MRHLVCILFALAVIGVYADEPEKLVDGTPTSISLYPHCCSLRNGNEHFCGCSIIGPYHVITAAHCIGPARQAGSSLTVVCGTDKLSSGGQVYRVSRMWAHEQYNAYLLVNDIGLMKLATPIQFNQRCSPIQLSTKDVTSNERLTIVAWGSEGRGQRIHNDLRKVVASCILPNACRPHHQGFMNIYPNEFCTYARRGTGACHGDSGSGVIRENDKTLMGIVSRGYPCADGKPDVCTNVYFFIPWIRQKMAL